jgi:ABC-type transport system involved in cytochrome c biogenesis permease subunit
MNRFLLLFLSFLIIACRLQASPPVDLSPMENLAIQENGRSKPMVVFAIESLRTLYAKDQWNDETTGEKISALALVMDLGFNPKPWLEKKMIRIDHLELKKDLGLIREEKYFSYAELAKSVKLQQLLEEVLAHRQVSKNREKLDPVLEAARGVGAKMELFERLAGGRAWNLVPHPSGADQGAWFTFPDANKYYTVEQLRPSLAAFDTLAKAYLQADEGGFTQAALELRQALRDLSPSVYPKEWVLQLEHFYVQWHPFHLAKICYLFLLVALSLTFYKARFLGYRMAWFFAVLGFLIQVAGFVTRILISGRAPVTNMYETVIWLGFGVMFFALIFEAIYRCRYFFMGAAPVAVISLILADSLPAVLNSAIHPLVPVLRHNFWLSTHVLSITSSYAALGLALGIGHIILIRVLFNKPIPSVLYQYLYRSLQVGVLLIGIGTILGGVWANYSWGRFWDWDPKETWALIAFLSYLAILHGRLAGWWGGFGLAVGSVLGFLSVLMAWYGVNFVLGQGLHSYGFGTGGLEYVTGFVVLELVFVGAAIWKHRMLGRKNI